MGGTITAQSQKGVGSTFTVFINTTSFNDSGKIADAARGYKKPTEIYHLSTARL